MRNVLLKYCIIFSTVLFFIGYLLFWGVNKYSRTKIVLICLDGATWNVMMPLLDKNELPNIRKLIDNGAHGQLFSEYNYSPPSWTSIATGKVIDKHGVINFFSGPSKIKYIWDILSESGIKVGVSNWVKANCRKLNGVIYRYKPYPVNSDCCYPESFKDRITQIASKEPLPDWKKVEVYKVQNVLGKITDRLNEIIINEFKPTFLALGFIATNPYQHRYWSAFEPQYFDITQEELIERGNLISGYYKKIDSLLGYFIKNNYTIVFVSDHGFYRNDLSSGPRIIKYCSVSSDIQHINFLMNSLLEKFGLLVVIPKPENGGQIDFLKSQAYYYNDIKRGITGIRINRDIVEAEGSAILRKSICLKLEGVTLENGEKVFLNITENDTNKDVDLPDIVFQLNPIFRQENISFKDGENLVELTPFNIPNGKLKVLKKIRIEGREYNLGEFISGSRYGVHENEGVIIMAGKNVRKGVFIKKAQLFDVTPTILYLLGLPISRDMDGKVIFEAIDQGFMQGNPIKFIETYEVKQREKSRLEDVNAKDEVDIERLHSLGYAH